MSVSLSVVAHTNVGKTTLVRTLLRRDIGEVADRPHVTENAERHTLIDTAAGDVLHLWDTPGFGDSARLERRLGNSGNLLGWLQTEVWDRLVDRPFYCSQQAMRNVRDESDVVLYLVNAAEDPAAAAYLDPELRILRWMGKPVLLLLNQAGAPRPRDAEAAEEARWSRRLAAHVGESATLTLDAFARCWVSEDRLLGAVRSLLAGEKRAEMERLRAAWRARNLEVFDAATRSMARHLAATAVDQEAVAQKADAKALALRVKRWIGRGKATGDPAADAAMAAMADRLAQRLREETDRLIALHGLSGHAQQRILERTAASFEVARPADVAGSGLVGGMLTGAAGGLAADLSAGGLTLGAGLLVGAILGALGAGGAAHAVNVMQGREQGEVRWSAEFLARRAEGTLLLYLAVAHYGRGRGEWVEGESPAHWPALVAREVAARAGALQAAWSMAQAGSTEQAVAARLEPEVRAPARGLLRALHPEAADVIPAAG